MSTKLRVIDYAKEINDSRECEEDYNTMGHTHAEILAKIPDLDHHGPSPQPWVLLSPFLSLIASSQKIPLNEIHEILLPRPFISTLLADKDVAFILGHISEDVEDEISNRPPTTTTRGDNIEMIISKGAWFPRLDTCSLKDALLPCPGFSAADPVQNATDLFTRLASSRRGLRGIEDLRMSHPEDPVIVYLLPWRNEVHPDLEYRCFCSPPDGKLVAISQYCWHAPWFHKDRSKEEQAEVAERLVTNIAKLHEQVMEHKGMKADLKQRGFVFDVVEAPATQEVSLLELNDFGAMCHCGSCLFQWIRDAEMLYGRKIDEGIEVRVTY